VFLRLSNCASVGEKTLIIIKMHGVYVNIMAGIAYYDIFLYWVTEIKTNTIHCVGINP